MKFHFFVSADCRLTALGLRRTTLVQSAKLELGLDLSSPEFISVATSFLTQWHVNDIRAFWKPGVVFGTLRYLVRLLLRAFEVCI